MSASIDYINHYKTISNTCYTANIAYIFLRIFYLILFIICKLYILVWVTAGTILLYLLCFLLIKKRKYYLYALVCGNEYFVYVSVATLMIGFSTGFHLSLIGLSVVSFFASYFNKTRDTNGSIVWAGLSIAIYLTLYFVSANNAPYYAIDRWLDMTLFTAHVLVVFTFVVFYLIVFVKYAMSLENKIINESRTDELTQINNRYALYDYFSQEKNKTNKVLALFDIDDFKNINDEYGHVTGDQVLKKVAELTSNTLKDSFVCRYGGEEFVVVTNKDKGFEKLEELRKVIEKEIIEYEGEKINITITIGVAIFAKDMNLAHWVELADRKMYTGKKSGKNKTVL